MNTTPSLPVGLYARSHPALTRGSLVEFCPPRGLLARWFVRPRAAWSPCKDHRVAFGKVLAGLPGDIVTVSKLGVAIDGVRLPHSAPAPAPAGYALPHVPDGVYRLAPGTAWLWTAHPHSYDSRYYGPVPITAVVDTIHLLVSLPDRYGSLAMLPVLRALARPGES